MSCKHLEYSLIGVLKLALHREFPKNRFMNKYDFLTIPLPLCVYLQLMNRMY
jgi:hypothetical protein